MKSVSFIDFDDLPFEQSNIQNVSREKRIDWNRV